MLKCLVRKILIVGEEKTQIFGTDDKISQSYNSKYSYLTQFYLIFSLFKIFFIGNHSIAEIQRKFLF